ncbi:MAG: pstA [Proteobacteria bacterium]|nr:pstA [Pseudomonadota bacterium]
MNLLSRRKLINQIALTLSMLAMAFGLFWLAWILYTVLHLGLAGLSLDIFTKMTPPPGAADGGLLNALAGSGLLVVVSTLVGTPLGILVGVYLAEYGRTSWLGNTTRYVNDLLLSAPSIVIGLFVWIVVVSRMGTYSGWAGILALSLIMIPVVVRTTENMLQLVPNTLREAAYALGAPKRKVIMSVTLRAAKSGVVTGLLLAIARIAGETAPLLFTALSNPFWSVDLGKPIANLPVTINSFAMSPFVEWQQIAWAGVLVMTACVLTLNVIARIFFRQEQSH